MAIEPKFKKDDYIINRTGNVMGIISKLDDKGYYHFKFFYGGMFDTVYDTKTELLQINYQKFFDFCNEEETDKINKLYKKYKDEAKQDKTNKSESK